MTDVHESFVQTEKLCRLPTALCRKTQNHSGVAKREWDCIRFGEIESENAAYKDLDFKNPTHRNPKDLMITIMRTVTS